MMKKVVTFLIGFFVLFPFVFAQEWQVNTYLNEIETAVGEVNALAARKNIQASLEKLEVLNEQMRRSEGEFYDWYRTAREGNPDYKYQLSATLGPQLDVQYWRNMVQRTKNNQKGIREAFEGIRAMETLDDQNIAWSYLETIYNCGKTLKDMAKNLVEKEMVGFFFTTKEGIDQFIADYTKMSEAELQKLETAAQKQHLSLMLSRAKKMERNYLNLEEQIGKGLAVVEIFETRKSALSQIAKNLDQEARFKIDWTDPRYSFDGSGYMYQIRKEGERLDQGYISWNDFKSSFLSEGKKAVQKKNEALAAIQKSDDEAVKNAKMSEVNDAYEYFSKEAYTFYQQQEQNYGSGSSSQLDDIERQLRAMQPIRLSSPQGSDAGYTGGPVSLSAVQAEADVQQLVNKIHADVKEINRLAESNLQQAINRLNDLNRAVENDLNFDFKNNYQKAREQNPSFTVQVDARLSGKFKAAYWENSLKKTSARLNELRDLYFSAPKSNARKYWEITYAIAKQVYDVIQLFTGTHEELTTKGMNEAWDKAREGIDGIKDNYVKLEEAWRIPDNNQMKKEKLEELMKSAKKAADSFEEMVSYMKANEEEASRFYSLLDRFNQQKKEVESGPNKRISADDSRYQFDETTYYTLLGKLTKDFADGKMAWNEFDQKWKDLSRQAEAEKNRIVANIRASDEVESKKQQVANVETRDWEAFSDYAVQEHDRLFDLNKTTAVISSTGNVTTKGTKTGGSDKQETPNLNQQTASAGEKGKADQSGDNESASAQEGRSSPGNQVIADASGTGQQSKPINPPVADGSGTTSGGAKRTSGSSTTTTPFLTGTESAGDDSDQINEEISNQFNDLLDKADEAFDRPYWQESQGVKSSSNPKQETIDYLRKAEKLLDQQGSMTLRFMMVYRLEMAYADYAERVFAYSSKTDFINMAGSMLGKAGSAASSITKDFGEIKASKIRSIAYKAVADAWRDLTKAALWGESQYNKMYCDQQAKKYYQMALNEDRTNEELKKTVEKINAPKKAIPSAVAATPEIPESKWSDAENVQNLMQDDDYAETIVTELKHGNAEIAKVSFDNNVGIKVTKAGTKNATSPIGKSIGVVPGDKIEVGNSASPVTMNFHSDQTSLAIKPGTTTTLLDDKILLEKGEVYVKEDRQNGDFMVVTPTAVIGPRGTEFSVQVDRFGKTNVQLYDGAIEIRNGIHISGLTPGEEANIESDSEPAQTKTFDTRGYYSKNWASIVPKDQKAVRQTVSTTGKSSNPLFAHVSTGGTLVNPHQKPATPSHSGSCLGQLKVQFIVPVGAASSPQQQAQMKILDDHNKWELRWFQQAETAFRNGASPKPLSGTFRPDNTGNPGSGKYYSETVTLFKPMQIATVDGSARGFRLARGESPNDQHYAPITAAKGKILQCGSYKIYVDPIENVEKTWATLTFSEVGSAPPQDGGSGHTPSNQPVPYKPESCIGQMEPQFLQKVGAAADPQARTMMIKIDDENKREIHWFNQAAENYKRGILPQEMSGTYRKQQTTSVANRSYYSETVTLFEPMKIGKPTGNSHGFMLMKDSREYKRFNTNQEAEGMVLPCGSYKIYPADNLSFATTKFPLIKTQK